MQQSEEISDSQLKRQEVVTIATSLKSVRHRKMLHLRAIVMLRVKELEILDLQKSEEISRLTAEKAEEMIIKVNDSHASLKENKEIAKKSDRLVDTVTRLRCRAPFFFGW